MKHLCIKKEDGLYINGAKCTDGFIEGKGYSESEFKVVFRYNTKEKGWNVKTAILLPALKEDSGEEEQTMLFPNNNETERWFEENIDNNCSASSAIYKFRLWLHDNYTITKK